jgi:hypothetical protein
MNATGEQLFRIAAALRPLVPGLMNTNNGAGSQHTEDADDGSG